MFGPDQPVILQLLEIPVEGPQKALKGVAMELDDCAFPLLQSMVLTGDADVAFKDANWALLVGSKPRGPGMERADLLKDNGKIFIAQGQSIDAVAADDCPRGGGGQPLQHQRDDRRQPGQAPAEGPLHRHGAPGPEPRPRPAGRRRPACRSTRSRDLFIYGNHSPTMFADFTHAKIGGKAAADVIGDEAWLKNDFLPAVGKRGAAIIEARGVIVGGLGGQRPGRPRARPGDPGRDPLGRGGRARAATASPTASGPACR